MTPPRRDPKLLWLIIIANISFSRQAQKPKMEIVDDDSRKPKSRTVNDTKKSSVSKKRALVDGTPDVEAPAAKRVRQESENAPPSPVKQGPKKYGRKSQHVKFSSPANDKDSRFATDFDEIPKPKQPQMKAMKGKDGKVAPKPRPVPTKKNKKQGEAKEAAQRKADVELQDADKTLVEQNEVDFSLLDWRLAHGFSTWSNLQKS